MAEWGLYENTTRAASYSQYGTVSTCFIDPRNNPRFPSVLLDKGEPVRSRGNKMTIRSICPSVLRRLATSTYSTTPYSPYQEESRGSQPFGRDESRGSQAFSRDESRGVKPSAGRNQNRYLCTDFVDRASGTADIGLPKYNMESTSEPAS
jgi:hypothetical protein